MDSVKKAIFFLIGSAAALAITMGIFLWLSHASERGINVNGNNATIVIKQKITQCRDTETGRFVKCP